MSSRGKGDGEKARYWQKTISEAARPASAEPAAPVGLGRVVDRKNSRALRC